MENNIEVMTDRKAPLEIQRTKTNFLSIVLTVIFLALWMGIAIFGKNITTLVLFSVWYW